MANFKNPNQLADSFVEDEIKKQLASDPTSRLPKEVFDYDEVLDLYLNGFDPEILKSENSIGDFAQEFIDNGENEYFNANPPIGWKIPKEHHDYIRNKVDELLNEKYSYLKPYHKRG